MPARQAALAFRLIYDYTAGFALADPTSPAEQRLADPTIRQELHTFLRALPASRFPALATHGTLAWTNDRDQRFSSGLEALLHGVQESLGPEASGPAADEGHGRA
jgi:Tetracyclin repressor-like, C-terminal domain